MAERHLSPDGNAALCVDCRRENANKGNARWRAAHPDEARQIARENKRKQREAGTDWASRNPDAAREYMREWADANREKVREHSRRNIAKYRAADPEKAREDYRRHQNARREAGTDWGSRNPEAVRESNRNWQKANPAKVRFHAMKYFTTKLKATPPWLTREHFKQMEAIYDAAVELSEATGTRYDVDHIVPLQGKTVCGLHVPWNLRVLTALENQRRPKFWSFEHQDTSSVGVS